MANSSRWLLAVESMQNFASTMRAGMHSEFAALIEDQVLRFVSQDIPASSVEMAIRDRQSTSLISDFSLISHASQMCRLHGDIAQEIYSLVENHSSQPLPLSEQDVAVLSESRSGLTVEISQLCFSSQMKRSRR